MINAITGKLVKICPDHVIVLTKDGVEYRLEVSAIAAGYFSSLQDKDSVRVLAFLQHREDAMTLFGFKNEEERFCFEQLQTVPGIGARQALKILSGITVDNLVKALDSQDVKTLGKISGVGPKTAQRLVLQLRNVLVLEHEDEEEGGSAPGSFRELIQSFTDMGYDRKLVSKTVETVLKENPSLVQGKSLHEAEAAIFPLVLRGLSR